MVEKIRIKNAEIGFRNFAGKEGMYNREGERSFVVFLEPELAEELDAEGWNVKFPKERVSEKDEEDNRSPYLPVDATFTKYPPKVVLINGDHAERLEEKELDILDWADISFVDLTVRPYTWNVQGKTGIKAYLEDIYVTIETDPFREKYGI